MSVRAWLRRLAGPDLEGARRVEDLRRRLGEALTEVDRLRAEAEATERAHRSLQSKMDKALHSAFEPQQGACGKVRLRDREEAEEFARKTCEDLGYELGALKPYQCKTCPRQPIGVGRYWHIANADPRQSTANRHAGVRTPEGEEAARRRGKRREDNGGDLEHRLPPGVAERLRGEAS